MYARAVSLPGLVGLLMAIAMEQAPPALSPCASEPAPRAEVAPPVFSLDPLLGQAWVGSVSVGRPTRGALLGAVELRTGEDVEHAGGYGFGTAQTVLSIERAAREVRRCFPHTPRLIVGDLSRQRGGFLAPHRSHQSGLDADLGYYFKGPAVWYQKGTAQNLDVARTYALVRALIEGGNVDTIFIDASIQRLLVAYAERLPPALQPGDDWFSRPTKRDTLIRHAWGHATHLHVRFKPLP